MLLLTFRAGDNRYAVEGRHVIEVIPRAELRTIPHAPPYVLGLLNYRGQLFPVVDFAKVAGVPASRDALSTRIILAEFQAGPGTRRGIGVLAESVDEVLRGETGQVVLAGMGLDEAPYLGGVYRFDDRLVQVIKPDRLLSGPMQDALYGGPAEVR
jgi:chemotaxis-related protein WspB